VTAAAQALDPWLKRAAVARNRRRALALNDRHLGETVFVIGASTQLNRLPVDQLRVLSREPAIGLNRTQYRVDVMYFMSLYAQESALALRAGKARAVIHACSASTPVVGGTIATFKRQYEADRGLPRRFDGMRPTLYTSHNSAFMATHLAVIMGARRVVYIGLEQHMLTYFYDEDLAVRERILADLAYINAKGLCDLDGERVSYERAVRDLKRPPEESAGQTYWHQSPTEVFPEPYWNGSPAGVWRLYFDELDRYGVEPIATSRNSIIYEAGARYVDLDEVLRTAPADALT